MWLHLETGRESEWLLNHSSKGLQERDGYHQQVFNLKKKNKMPENHVHGAYLSWQLQDKFISWAYNHL